MNYTGFDMHANENVGLWDTTITHDEYMAMASQQQDSMTPPTVQEDDLPEEPVPIVPDDDEEPAEEENQVTAQKPQDTASFRSQPKMGFISTRPSCPLPFGASIGASGSEKQKLKIDVSGVKVGTILKHKIFGEGTVRKIAGGKIFVVFGKAEKSFIFPDVFEQGFLKLI